MVNYPSVITSLINPLATDKLNSPSHSGIETAQNTDITAIETFIGTTNTSVVGTIIYDVRSPLSDGGGHVQSAVKGGTGQTTFTKGDTFVATSASVISKFAVGADGYAITADSAAAAGMSWQGVATGKSVQDQSNTYAAASVLSASVYGITFANIVSVLSAGQAFQVKFPTTNTTSVLALQVSSLVAQRIKLPDLTNPEVGTITASMIGIVENDGTNWQLQRPSETLLTLTDITTNNVSALRHGFAPKNPGNTSTFLRGDGTYASVASGGGGGSTQSGKFISSVIATSSNVFADISGFAFGIAANATYIINGDLQLTPNNGGTVFQLTGPASPTTVDLEFLNINSATSGGQADTGTSRIQGFSSTLGSASFGAGSGNRNWVPLRGVIVNGVNAGSVVVQWKAGTNTEVNQLQIGSNFWATPLT